MIIDGDLMVIQIMLITKPIAHSHVNDDSNTENIENKINNQTQQQPRP